MVEFDSLWEVIYLAVLEVCVFTCDYYEFVYFFEGLQFGSYVYAWAELDLYGNFFIIKYYEDIDKFSPFSIT